MSSIIHYKFKNSSGTWDSIEFEGSFISLYDLKRSIVASKKLSRSGSGDFDLLLTNTLTNEDYTEDYSLIPKNTSVTVKRVPATRAKALTLHIRE